MAAVSAACGALGPRPCGRAGRAVAWGRRVSALRLRQSFRELRRARNPEGGTSREPVFGKGLFFWRRRWPRGACRERLNPGCGVRGAWCRSAGGCPGRHGAGGRPGRHGELRAGEPEPSTSPSRRSGSVLPRNLTSLGFGRCHRCEKAPEAVTKPAARRSQAGPGAAPRRPRLASRPPPAAGGHSLSLVTLRQRDP